MRYMLIAALVLISCDTVTKCSDPLDSLEYCSDASGVYYPDDYMPVNGDYSVYCLPYSTGRCGDWEVQTDEGEECDDDYVLHTPECPTGIACVDCRFACQ